MYPVTRDKLKTFQLIDDEIVMEINTYSLLLIGDSKGNRFLIKRGDKMENKIMLITYPNSLGNDLKDLNYVLNTYMKDQINGVHILPFYPSSADRGFAPMTYQEVDPAYGSFEDIKTISENYELMVDFMINHISRSSVYFQDFIQYKECSKYKELFIDVNEFYDGREPSEDEIALIYKRKPKAPFQEVRFANGSKAHVWCTFADEQIDLDVTTETTQTFIKENLQFLCEQGVKYIRADAFAYVTKKENTNCFFVEPETWDILDLCRTTLKPYDVVLLPEIHEHYTIQKKIDEKGYYAYDFALPMLVLYTLYSKKNNRLLNWFKIAPKKQFTTLDTHDGIGVVDVKDLLTPDETVFTQEALFSRGANVKKIYNSEKYNNLDVYQLNCTYYSALGDDDKAYLLARAIQFFAPGIPQVYYVGMLAGANDVELIEKTKHGRDINRHNYSLDEIEEEVKRPVIRALFELMKLRNEHDGFNGEMTIGCCNEDELCITWSVKEDWIRLEANLKTYDFTIHTASGNVFESKTSL